MSGKPRFDESAVITAAVGIFWRHGYAAASISDLTEATGLSRSSLYQRFGDKDGLFLEALEAYTQRVLRRMNTPQDDSARGRMERLLRAFLPDPSAPPRPPGCLIGRSCLEAADLTEAGHRAAQAAAARQHEILTGILHEGVRSGELPPDSDIDALGWHFFGVMQTVVNLPHTGASPDMVGRVIEVAMASWPVKF